MENQSHKGKNGEPEEKGDRWQVWWDRLTLIPLYIVIMAGLIADVVKDGSLDNQLLVLIAVALNTGVANIFIRILRHKEK